MSKGDMVSLTPDASAASLTKIPVDPLRYDGQSDHPTEVAGMLRALMPSGVRVLDVGCGTGSVTTIANHGKGNDVTAIEPDPDRAQVARSRGIDAFTGTLDEAFIQRHGTFDVLMSSDVLEHTVAPADFLQLLIQAVKPGGLILLSVPNVAHWSVRLNLLFGRFDYEDVGIMDATHLRWFTGKSLLALLETSGLKVLQMTQTAGVSLPTYQRGFLRRLPGKGRSVRFMTRLFPLLFGVQHVIKARVNKAHLASNT